MNHFNIFQFVIYIAIILAAIFRITEKHKNWSVKKSNITEQDEVTELSDLITNEKFLTKEEIDKLIEEYTVTTESDNSAYIQNNAKLIIPEICVATPSFNANAFLNFAKDVFKKLTDAHDKNALGTLVADSVDLNELPTEILRFDVCFLHNYIIENKKEHLKVLLTLDTKETINDRSTERYFAIFSKENPLLKGTKGELISISCPHCGGNLNFGNSVVLNCPYCGNTVTFAEYDWVLTSVEKVKPGTIITNMPVLRN